MPSIAETGLMRRTGDRRPVHGRQLIPGVDSKSSEEETRRPLIQL